MTNSSINLPTSHELQSLVDFRFLNNDSVQFFVADTVKFSGKHFDKIVIGYQNEYYSFIPQDTVKAIFIKVDNHYTLYFRYTSVIPYEWSRFWYNHDHVVFKLRFLVDQHDYRAVKFQIYPHKSTYETAEIFLRKSDIIGGANPYSHFYDLHLTNDKLFYLQWVSYDRIFMYDLASRISTKILSTWTYFFSYADGYLFGPFSENAPSSDKIMRYDLSTQEMDLEFGAVQLSGSYMWGLETYKDKLYVLYSKNHNQQLSSFTLDGDFIESIPFEGSYWGFCIYHDIVYAIDLGEEYLLHRFDLSEKKFLTPLLLPSESIRGIQIKNNMVYYTLYGKYMICRIPLDHLEEVN